MYSDDVLVGNVHEGELVGYMGILMEATRTARIVADKPCDLLAITEGEFYSLLQVRPDLCKQRFKEMAQRIDVLNKQVSGAADSSAMKPST